MKKIFRLLFLLAPFAVSAQNADSVWIMNNYTKKELYIPMRDGVKLFTVVYVPKSTDEQHPIILTRTPYSCAPYGEDKFPPLWYSTRKYFLKENYYVVQQDVRGRWMSEGKFVDVRPYNPDKKSATDIDESTDAYDTIDWLTKNLKNNNNKVGVYGTSYPG